MDVVMITAMGVGGATVIGAIIGFVFKKISHKFSDIVLSFAAGVMLAAKFQLNREQTEHNDIRFVLQYHNLHLKSAQSHQLGILEH